MSEKRDKQIKQIANECFPDTGFIFGAMWADKNPDSDNEEAMEDNRDEE